MLVKPRIKTESTEEEFCDKNSSNMANVDDNQEPFFSLINET